MLALGLVLATLAGELALRLFWPQRSSVVVGMFQADPDAGYRLKPDYKSEIRVPEYRVQVRTDGEGYRVPRDGVTTDDREARILCIGDSFTFGVGVDAEEAFPERLEGRLQEEWPGIWAVRNGGVGGYGPLRSARRLEADQGRWRPDVVVHTLYLGNDLEDPRPDSYLTSPRIRDGRMVSADRPLRIEIRLFLRTRSHLYAFLRQSLYGVYVATGVADRTRYVEPVGQRRWPDRIERIAFPAAIRSVEEARAWCEANGARYVAVLAPTAWQVDDRRWDRYRRTVRLPDEALDRDRARREVMTELTECGIEVLDLFPVLQRATAEGRAPYFRHDTHWSATGHDVAAAEIHRWLARRGWVGPAAEESRAVVRTEPPAREG